MRLTTLHVLAAAAGLLAGRTATVCLAQTGPVNGMRPAPLRTHAIVGGDVVVAPGKTIEEASILIRDGVIEAVGRDLAIPPEARVWSAQGLTIYPGLIDMALLIDLEKAGGTGNGSGNGSGGAGAHWNSRVHPEIEMVDRPAPPASLRKELRGMGFTAAAVYPAQGAMRGTGAVLALADDDEHVLAYRQRASMGFGFAYGGSWTSGSYPGSLMGSIALLRQTLYDAEWHAACRRIWEADPSGHEPPIRADALDALADVRSGRQQVLWEVSDEHNVLRAARIAREFDLEVVILGSGLEFRRLEPIVATGLPFVVPLRFPDRPKVSALPEADDVTLREMMTWEQAPTNPRRLLEAGVTVALTTHRLEKRGDFLGALRKAVKHGLSEQDALAALTTTPARLLELDHMMGTLEPGKVANLVTVEGSLFDKKPKVRATWINGRRHEISSEPRIKFVGKGTLRTDSGVEAPVELDTVKTKLTVHLPDDTKATAKGFTFQHDRLSFVLDGRLFDTEGYVRFSGVLSESQVMGVGEMPTGEGFAYTITPVAPTDDDDEATDGQPPPDPSAETADDDDGADPSDPSGGPSVAQASDAAPEPAEAEAAAPPEPPDGDESPQESEEEPQDDDPVELPPEDLVYPLGAFGLAEPPRRRTVAIVGATVWTAGPAGIIDDAAILVRGGRLAYVGEASRFDPPPDAQVIDATGKHLTPGLIDCHSHTGISGGVNEWTQTVSAEVRIGDVVNPDDINWYRELAGGLTVANLLHGSANPIGGQNRVVKLRWSGTADDLSIDDAIAGIKFALGENVKRSQSRYPNTRMGVEAVIRDAFIAAREYRARLDRYLALSTDERVRTMPPRRDLELDALVEILDGQRIVHCHSYRQDEILMLIRLADEFGFTVGTFQHVLEGYKVADAIAAHGAGASTFSDWWAYKVEVMDAIPHNGALMHDVGVLVSFNSDSSELARRMNTEAAKAVRYGGVDPHEALKFVTINPARQLRIDHRCGSLEVGKDADFAIWSESPLSTFARCEQTWIEGARYFDLDQDRALREQARAERRRLVQKILRGAHGKPKAPEQPEAAAQTQPEGDPAEPAAPPEPEPEPESDPEPAPDPEPEPEAGHHGGWREHS